MLTIRSKQLEPLKRARLAEFENRLVSHLREFFPAECGSLDQQGIRETVRHGVERGRAYGFIGEREICKYLNLMFTFGRDWDRDSDLAWARELLQSGDIASLRMKRLYRAALARAHEGRGLLPPGGSESA